MTGCQEKNSDFFLKLPLKELQNLCKTHDLPTNKTRVKLANSLASFFKKKNAYTSSLEDRSSSPVKASYTIPLSESQCKETAHPPEEGRRAVVGAFEARTNSSECDSCKLMSGTKVVGADRSHCQVGIQGGCIAAKEIESSKCLESQSSPVRRPKRSYHSEFPSKSQHANSKNKRTMSLRSAKALERETFPRRSTRHIKWEPKKSL